MERKMYAIGNIPAWNFLFLLTNHSGTAVFYFCTLPYNTPHFKSNETTVDFGGLRLIVTNKPVMNTGIHFQCKLPLGLQYLMKYE